MYTGSIIHAALSAEGLDPVVFFHFLQVNSSELDLEAKDSWGFTPIAHAISNQSDPVFVSFLLTAGVNLENRFFWNGQNDGTSPCGPL